MPSSALEAELDISEIAEKKLEHCAGNSMHLPSVGFAMLVAVLALKPKGT